MIKIKRILFILLFAMLLYSRFVNLSWGLPYPMHPDERNMANAIQQLQCPIQNSEFRIVLIPISSPMGNFLYILVME